MFFSRDKIRKPRDIRSGGGDRKGLIEVEEINAILPGRVGGHRTSNRCGQGMHYRRRHPENPPRPLCAGSAAEKAAEAQGGLNRVSRCLPAPLTCAPSARPSGRSGGTVPFRIGRSRDPGAGIRGRKLLGIGYSDGRTCSQWS